MSSRAETERGAFRDGACDKGLSVFWGLAILSLFVSTLVVAQTDQPGAGIARDLAEWRAANIHDLRCDLRLRIAKLASDPIAGEATLRFTLRDASVPLVLDFAPPANHVRSLVANGEPGHGWVNGHLVIPAPALRVGENVVTIHFTAGDDALNRSDDFLYALFVPARACRALPCFDQPSLKARWTLAVQVPGEAAWHVVSNGALRERVQVDSPGGPGAGAALSAARTEFVEYRFAETPPLPTYLFSFVVGDFQVETDERSGRPMRMFHRETDARKVARNRDAIFDLHARSLEYLERYTGIPYMFGKFDFVILPAFQFGGMEHAGKILYNAPVLLLDESATQEQHLNRAALIAHETAHTWFGNFVTMQWFDDVWMKEVFANFMAAKIVNPSFPEVNHELRFLFAHHPVAYDVDRTPGSNPIRQPLENLNEAGSLYGAIIYQKAPVVMRQLEAMMGEENFRAGVRAYLNAHPFGNATWPDLIAVLDRRTPDDLAHWSRVWVDEPGQPTIATELTLADGRITRLAFRQSDSWGRPITWPQQLRVTLGYEGRAEEIVVPLEGAVAVASEAVGKPAPRYVLPSGGGWAYGGFALDSGSLDYLSASLLKISDPLTRGAAWVTLWDSMLDRAWPATRFVDLAMRALPREADEQLTGHVLGRLRQAWWRFLPAPEREARQAKLEALLRDGLAAAKTASQKSAWFNAVRDVAMNPETLAWLRRVWAQEEEVSGLPLAEADHAVLAQQLALREVGGWSELVATQLARMQDPDRKARFAFVLPALSADPAERERWFATLQNVSSRRREPWVIDGLNCLHHPLRAAASAKLVRPSLEMLPEIQRTGDIFFPTQWMVATLSGHASHEAANTVSEFLATRPPDYPVRLRNIILRTADLLYRAAEIGTPTR